MNARCPVKDWYQIGGNFTYLTSSVPGNLPEICAGFALWSAQWNSVYHVRVTAPGSLG